MDLSLWRDDGRGGVTCSETYASGAPASRMQAVERVPQFRRLGLLMVERDTLFEVIKPISKLRRPEVIGEENVCENVLEALRADGRTWSGQ